MKTVLVSASAFALGFGLLGAPAFAQSSRTLNVWGAHIDAPASAYDFVQPIPEDDVATTGSVRSHRGAPRGAAFAAGRIDASAKGGNAEENDRSVPNYGMTSGGPDE
ncbi:hypothetical protein [Methylobacterium oxalidis]|uniref:hypothetical protein n=1 Tax=Methylobacterium oxalidis TaxID=944322 RepID=UPI003315D384